MNYLTIIKDKGYQEYIDDVARGLEAEEQLAISENTTSTPKISIGKIVLISLATMISSALIFIAIAIAMRHEEQEEAPDTQEPVVQKEALWNCDGNYTNSPNEAGNCQEVYSGKVIDDNGNRSITPDAPK